MQNKSIAFIANFTGILLFGVSMVIIGSLLPVLKTRFGMSDIAAGNIAANFIEGMACKGGCVGGPGRIIAQAEGKAAVETYANAASIKTPPENTQVYAILNNLGYGDNFPPLSGKSPIAALLARKLEK